MITIRDVFEYRKELVKEITMANDKLEVKFLNLGATITSIKLKNNDTNLVVSYENIEDYKTNSEQYYLGATIGPLAGRTAKGQFVMDEQTYQLDINSETHHLHGGSNGLSTHVLEYLYEDDELFPSLVFIQEIDHTKEGYPGSVKYFLSFKLVGSLLITNFKAYPSVKMPLILTSHMYFNLGNSESIEDHLLSIAADGVVKLDDTYAPTDEIIPVVKSAFDFNEAKPIKEAVRIGHSQFEMTRGLDHAFILNDKCSANLRDPHTKTSLQITTTTSSLVCYTSNFFDEGFTNHLGLKAKNYSAIALEPQNIPNGVNLNFDEKKFYTKNDPYDETTYYQFTLD